MAAPFTSRLIHLRTPHLHFHLLLPTISRSFCSFSPNSSLTATTKPSLPTLQPSHDADLISNILIEHHNPFHAMESSLQLYGISLSSSLLHQTLIRLSHLSKIALSFFSYSLTSHPSAIDVASFNLIVDIFGKVRQFDVVWQLILQMQTLNLKPQNSTFMIFIRRLIAANFTRQAIRVFDDMPCFTETEACKDDFVYVIDTLCKYGFVRVAMELLNKRKCGFELCMKVYAVLIDGWCKIRRVDMGKKLLREMIDKGIEPNVVCYNILLNGICRK